MTIQPGTDIGRYHILEQLGEGGMAVVYKAYDTHLENEVAIKIIRTGSLTPDSLPRIQKRFQIEAKKMASMTHPNIVNVMDYGEHEGAPYLVMPYLPGGTLKEMLGDPLSVDEAANILLPIADALSYAHAEGLIHRDIKPSNILITKTGQPMLSDFGVTKVLESEETLDLTMTGMGVGTPEYMAPEQGEGRSFDHRVDIYALGIVLYEMVTGRKPFTADTPMAVIVKQMRDPLPKPTMLNPNLPEETERVLFKALAKDPNDRYADMSAFSAALENLPRTESKHTKQKPARIVPEKEYAPKEKLARKKTDKKPFDTRWLIGAMGAFGLGLIIFAGIKLFSGGEKPKQAATETENAVETPTPALGIDSSMLSEKDGMTLVYVPEGEFEMGSEDGESNESPAHTVYLDAFWIDQTEVTNAQYGACVQSGSCGQPAYTSHFDNSNYDDHPVVYMNWGDAQDYCEWAGRRLPTEAEWEKAARGDDGRTYPWGENIFCSQANYWDCGYGEFSPTSPVGFYGTAGASPYGAYDMAGNAWEWVADWYSDDYYQGSPSNNPTGPENGSYRVLRGGSWDNNEWYARSAYRYDGLPDFTYYSLGFRCARSP